MGLGFRVARKGSDQTGVVAFLLLLVGGGGGGGVIAWRLPDSGLFFQISASIAFGVWALGPLVWSARFSETVLRSSLYS